MVKRPSFLRLRDFSLKATSCFTMGFCRLVISFIRSYCSVRYVLIIDKKESTCSDIKKCAL